MLIIATGVLPACRSVVTTTAITTAIATSTATTTTTTTTTAIVTRCVSYDFYIIYETSWHTPDRFVTLLDTRSNIIGKPLGPSDYVYTTYYISCEYLRAIYDGVVAYDIKSYSSPDLLKSDNVVVVPRMYYKITFWMNGEVYSIFCDNSIFATFEEKFLDLSLFKSRILDYYHTNSDEYKAFPPATALPT